MIWNGPVREVPAGNLPRGGAESEKRSFAAKRDAGARTQAPLVACHGYEQGYAQGADE